MWNTLNCLLSIRMLSVSPCNCSLDIVFQTWMSVQMGHTSAATMPSVTTQWARIVARARMDSLEMDSPAQVTHTHKSPTFYLLNDISVNEFCVTVFML